MKIQGENKNAKNQHKEKNLDDLKEIQKVIIIK